MRYHTLPAWTGAENITFTGIRTLDRPVRSKLLSRLFYPGPPHAKVHSDTSCLNFFSKLELEKLVHIKAQQGWIIKIWCPIAQEFSFRLPTDRDRFQSNGSPRGMCGSTGINCIPWISTNPIKNIVSPVPRKNGRCIYWATTRRQRTLGVILGRGYYIAARPPLGSTELPTPWKRGNLSPGLQLPGA